MMVVTIFHLRMLSLVLFFLPTLWGASETGFEENIGFYNHHRSKEISINVCSNDTKMTRVPIPQPPVCSKHLHKPRTNLRPIHFSIVTILPAESEMEIVYCSKKIVRKTCWEGFFGATTEETSTEYQTLTVSECELMASTWLKNTSSIIKGKESVYSCSWLSTVELIDEITIVQRSTALFERQDGVLHHNFPVGHVCNALEGYCRGKEGVLIWNSTGLPTTCLYTPRPPVAGLISNSQNKEGPVLLTSEELRTIIHFSVFEKVIMSSCNFTSSQLFLSDEGLLILFYTNSNASILATLSLPEEHWNYHIINSTTLKKHRMLSMETTSSSVSYAFSKYQSSTQEILMTIEKQICTEKTSTWESAWGMRHVAPQTSARMFLSRQDVEGFIYGNSIFFQKCDAVDDWEVSTSGLCGDVVMLMNPAGFCLDTVTMHAKQCQPECPQITGSLILPFNSTHQMELMSIPFTFIKTNRFFSEFELNDQRIDVIGHPLYTYSDISHEGLFSNFIEEVHTRLLTLEGYFGSEVIISKPHKYKTVGSPLIFTLLGFAAGRVSSLGSWLWTLAWLTLFILWVIVMVWVLHKVKRSLCKRGSQGVLNPRVEKRWDSNQWERELGSMSASQ